MIDAENAERFNSLQAAVPRTPVVEGRGTYGKLISMCRLSKDFKIISLRGDVSSRVRGGAANESQVTL